MSERGKARELAEAIKERAEWLRDVASRTNTLPGTDVLILLGLAGVLAVLGQEEPDAERGPDDASEPDGAQQIGTDTELAQRLRTFARAIDGDGVDLRELQPHLFAAARCIVRLSRQKQRLLATLTEVDKAFDNDYAYFGTKLERLVNAALAGKE